MARRGKATTKKGEGRRARMTPAAPPTLGGMRFRRGSYKAATTLPTSRPRVMAMPMDTPAMGVK